MHFDPAAWRRGNYLLLGLFALFCLWSAMAFARDGAQWADQPPHIRQWFNSLRQPDNPAVSCCGESDATEADSWVVHPDGSVTATVTNGRGFVPDGTVVEVPHGKVVVGEQNPTGHSILFLSPQKTAYCFIMGSGI